MKNEKLFNETTDKLVNAYFEGTLKHGKCNSCAVTHIAGTRHWGNCFQTFRREDMDGDFEILRAYGDYVQAKPIKKYHVFLNTSGYSIEELMDIEWAFETAPSLGDWEFNGLMAVVDVLEKIHECGLETTNTTKKRFVKSIP